MKQKYSSKNTSINTNKIPAIYNKINFEKLRGKIIFDYGAGKVKTGNLIRNLLEPYDIEYIPYDLYNLSAADNCYALERMDEADIYVCSNVLNVIAEYDIVQKIINEIRTHIVSSKNCNNKIFFFKIYEGNKTGEGKVTKKDCFQRNALTKDYITYWDWSNMYPFIYKGIITNIQGKAMMK